MYAVVVGNKQVLLNLDEDVHAALAKAAAERGTSVSALLREGARLVLADMYGGELRRSADMKAVMAELSDVLAKLQDGHVLVPKGALPAGSWDDMMREGST
jgi:plasmid stability protein